MKKDSKILIITIACVYGFFTILKLFLFPEFTATLHLLSSILGFVILLSIITAIRCIDILLDRVYPYERSIVVRMILQFAASLIIVFSLRSLAFPYVTRIMPFHITRELYAAITAAHILFVATIMLTMFGFRFFRKWQETELKKEILEREKATVQYDNLKNQLNPHFLFNSLTSLNSLIFENPQLASEFLHQLSRVYRYVLENKDKTLVTLSTEVSFISNYVQLLIARFDKGLQVNINISEPAMEQKILPVTLQILIENAMKHNITAQDSPLVIDIYDEGQYLVVRNNLQIKQIVDDSNGQGLTNLSSLYKVLIESEIVIEKNDVSFIVKIPLL